MSVKRLPNGAIPLPSSSDEHEAARTRLRDTVERDMDEHANTILWVRVERGQDTTFLSVNSYLIEGNGDLAVEALQAAMAMLQELSANLLGKQTGKQVDHQGKEMTRN